MSASCSGAATTSKCAGWLVEFETSYDEAKRRKHDKRKPAAARSYGSASQEAQRFAALHLEQRELVRDRLENGFQLRFGKEVGGRFRKPFTEEGLRSEENPVLKYFVTLVPKLARASNDKGTLAVQCRSKLLTLDFAYIELRKSSLAALRVDCDGVFVSPAACRFALEEALRDQRIPCLPHIVTGDLLDDGRFARPHFVWLLENGVWNSEDERCREAPRRLFAAVGNALAGALIDIGADPAAPTTTMRMKNPISPFWHTFTPNSAVWPSLSEFAEFLDLSTPRAVLVRKAAEVQSKLGVKASNELFDALRAEARRILAAWHFSSNANMRLERAALAGPLHEALKAFAEEAGIAVERTAYVAEKVAVFEAGIFDAAKLDKKVKNRGTLAAETSRLKSLSERQAAGGRYASASKAANTLSRLLIASQTLFAKGEAVTQAAVARESGASRRTVVAHWNKVVPRSENNPEECEVRCIVKEEPAGRKAGKENKDTASNGVSSSTARIIAKPTVLEPVNVWSETTVFEPEEEEDLRIGSDFGNLFEPASVECLDDPFH